MAEVCPCGKGYVSAYDGKCGHCRTRKEQSKHVHTRLDDTDWSEIDTQYAGTDFLKYNGVKAP